MSMKRKFFSVINNPLFLIPPLILVLGLAWQQYTYAGRDLNLPGHTNVFPDGTFTTFNGDGMPSGWQISTTGELQHTISQTKGYVSGHSLKITIHNYKNGVITLTGPKVDVKPDTAYLFKGYYSANTPFSLLTRYYYTDGSSSTRLERSYPITGSAWSTASNAFAAPTNLQNVQIIYRLYHDGQLQINGLYLEPRDNVYVEPAVSGTNTVPGSDFSVGDYDRPNEWLTYHTGTNNAAFSYQQTNNGNFIQTEVSNYKNGEAKWQYTPQTVQPHQYYQFGVDYQSNTTVPVIAEYVLADGTRQERTIMDLPPADQWTSARHTLEVPAGAATMFVSLPLRHNGTLSTRRYELIDATRPGPATWQQPVVSITFDDGWQQSYNNAAPLIKQYGYKATFYVNPTAIETPHFMTAAQLATLSSTGSEIGAHGHEHTDLTTLKNSAVDYQLREGRDYLQRAGFQVTNMATPYGRSDPEVEWYARKYFTTLRGGVSGINTRQNLEPYNLKVLYVNDTTSTETIEKALQDTKAANGWLILVYHQIDDEPSTGKGLSVENATTSVKQFKDQLQQINASGLQVLPIAAAYTELEQHHD